MPRPTEHRPTDKKLAEMIRKISIEIDDDSYGSVLRMESLANIATILESRKPEPAEWWETDDGHLFLTGVNLQVKDNATVCLRCYKQFEDCYEGEPCASKKDGHWTDIGIDAILTSLKEGDDREIVKIPFDAAEIIEQLRKPGPAGELEARIRKLPVEFLPETPRTDEAYVKLSSVLAEIRRLEKIL